MPRFTLIPEAHLLLFKGSGAATQLLLLQRVVLLLELHLYLLVE